VQAPGLSACSFQLVADVQAGPFPEMGAEVVPGEDHPMVRGRGPAGEDDLPGGEVLLSGDSGKAGGRPARGGRVLVGFSVTTTSAPIRSGGHWRSAPTRGTRSTRPPTT